MKRPFIYMNMATSIDGKITSTEREYPTFTSRYDRQMMERLRADADAIVIGAATLRIDNPPLQIRDEGMRRYRQQQGKAPGIINVLVTASGRVDPHSRFFTAPECPARIIATVASAPAENIAPLRDVAEVWTLGETQVDVRLLVEKLAERGVKKLLLEGGGDLNWHFIEHNLVDEVYVTIAPTLIGGRNAPSLLEGRGFSLATRKNLHLMEVRQEGDELYCRYKVHHDD